MDALWYVFYLLITLGVLVTVHELGHYVVARASGVRILRFSVGMGRPLYLWKDSRGTEFVIAAIPLGGYLPLLAGFLYLRWLHWFSRSGPFMWLIVQAMHDVIGLYLRLIGRER